MKLSYILQQEKIEIDEFLTYEEKPVQLLDRKIKELKNQQIPLVKILWRNHGVEDAIWEMKEEMQKKYPELFVNQFENFENEILFKGRECEDPKKILLFFYFILFL